MTINIELKRSGFPVKIGEFEFWFDTSNEAMKRFIKINEVVNDKYNAYLKELSDRANKGEFDDAKNGEINDTVIDQAIEFEKKKVEIKYDVLFGEGSFEKLYAKYPDYLALDEALDQADTLIGKELEKIQKEREEKAKEHTADYLTKTKAKKAKNKSKK